MVPVSTSHLSVQIRSIVEVTTIMQQPHRLKHSPPTRTGIISEKLEVIDWKMGYLLLN